MWSSVRHGIGSYSSLEQRDRSGGTGVGTRPSSSRAGTVRRMIEDPRAREKQEAGERAVDWIESGMIVGLGTGSTVIFAIRKIGSCIASGELRDITGVPTSNASKAAALEIGIPVTDLAGDVTTIDVTIDGADEVDPALNLVKGGGGALLHEKIVAQASRREVIVVDAGKPSARLGTRHVLPVEVIPFSAAVERAYLESIGATVVARTQADGSAFVTDEGNVILDCDFGPIDDLERLDALLHARAGVVEHGLFLGLTNDLLIAGPDGVEHRTAP
jgi:ribose 5-phosphate isomerase A